MNLNSLTNLKTTINDLEVENSKVHIEHYKDFNVKHFEREGDTKIEFGDKMKKDNQKKILDETIKDDKAKENKDDSLLKDAKMTQAEHDRLKKELDQGIKAS